MRRCTPGSTQLGACIPFSTMWRKLHRAPRHSEFNHATSHQKTWNKGAGRIGLSEMSCSKVKSPKYRPKQADAQVKLAPYLATVLFRLTKAKRQRRNRQKLATRPQAGAHLFLLLFSRRGFQVMELDWPTGIAFHFPGLAFSFPFWKDLDVL